MHRTPLAAVRRTLTLPGALLISLLAPFLLLSLLPSAHAAQGCAPQFAASEADLHHYDVHTYQGAYLYRRPPLPPLQVSYLGLRDSVMQFSVQVDGLREVTACRFPCQTMTRRLFDGAELLETSYPGFDDDELLKSAIFDAANGYLQPVAAPRGEGWMLWADDSGVQQRRNDAELADWVDCPR